MDTTSGRPFWLVRHALQDAPPPLQADIRCDALVIGCGVTGSLIADALCRDRHEVVLIDRRAPMLGSTCASTALLQYEIDAPLHALIAKVGVTRGVRAYQACLRALYRLRDLCEDLGTEVGFRSRPSLYLASDEAHVPDLHAELIARRRWQLPVRWLEREELQARTGISAACALWTPVAAEVDPWLLAQALLARCAAAGARIYAHTEALCVEDEDDGVSVRTATGRIRARHVVFAAGYESMRFLDHPVASLHASFAFASAPLAEFGAWPERCLIWESARPYVYARTTLDGRVIAGGADIALDGETLRESLLDTRVAQVLARVRDWFPALQIEPEFCWAGSFAETGDGLARIGPAPGQSPARHYALCYGGNGITYSVIAADLIAASIRGDAHPESDVFAFPCER